jgi:Rha family phage regulatory protein
MENLVVIQNNKVVTTSLKVAEVFEKRHDTVLRNIKNLDCSGEFTARNFAVSEYVDSTGKKNPLYNITRDGFVFLAMGFTGKKASQFKEAYINAFNNMEEYIKNQQKAQEETIDDDSDLVYIRDDRVLTSSYRVADKFRKTHSNIVKIIEKLVDDLKVIKIHKQDKKKFYVAKSFAHNRRESFYEFDSHFFTLLSTKLTGEKALQYITNYIIQFSDVEGEFNHWFEKLCYSVVEDQKNGKHELPKDLKIKVISHTLPVVSVTDKNGNVHTFNRNSEKIPGIPEVQEEWEQEENQEQKEKREKEQRKKRIARRIKKLGTKKEEK